MRPGPIRLTRFFHEALRFELAYLEREILAAELPTEVEHVQERMHTFTRVLLWHAIGEDEEFFPALEEKVPNVTLPYCFDHEYESSRFHTLDVLADQCVAEGHPHDLIELKREISIVRHYIVAHMEKEEIHLWPLTEENFSESEQQELIQGMMGVVPRSGIITVVPWVLTRVSDDSVIECLRSLYTLFEDYFSLDLKQIIKSLVDEERWTQMIEAIPDLTE